MGRLRKLTRRLRKRVVRLIAGRGRGATYADRVMERLNAGKVHASLGPNLKAGSADRAKRTFDRLVEKGLKPEHVVVDFGCGTLRLGKLLIEYLEPGGYIGVDIDQRLLDIGRGMLPAGMAEAKRPMLRVISPESLMEAAASKPYFIYSGGVLQHVPPEELTTFFGNIATIATESTKIEVRASKLKPKASRISVNTWSHALDEIEIAAKTAGLSLKTFRSKNREDGYLVLEKATLAQPARAPLSVGDRP